MGLWSCLHTSRRQVEALNPGPGWDGGLSTPLFLVLWLARRLGPLATWMGSNESSHPQKCKKGV